MRYAYENPDIVKLKGQHARETIIQHFSLTSMGNSLLSEISRIREILFPSSEYISTASERISEL